VETTAEMLPIIHSPLCKILHFPVGLNVKIKWRTRDTGSEFLV